MKRTMILSCLAMMFASFGFAEKGRTEKKSTPVPTQTPEPAKFDKAVWS